jgi:YrbI family 3-deoxy-D-manno-octulosonate 8-phosphate phosphatase
MKLSLENIDAFVFDFDGVMTNNQVFIDQDGRESVSCNRADGLAFDVLRKLGKVSFILSSEKNTVVKNRAAKLNISAIYGVANKVEALRKLANNNSYNLKNILYVGNDLNDYQVMRLCGFSVCPADSHPKIKELSDIILKTKGGDGVIRDLVENVLNIDFIEILKNV